MITFTPGPDHPITKELKECFGWAIIDDHQRNDIAEWAHAVYPGAKCVTVLEDNIGEMYLEFEIEDDAEGAMWMLRWT